MLFKVFLDQSLLIFEASRSHSDTLYSVGLLCTSDQSKPRPLPHNTTVTRDSYRRDSNLQFQQACGHWDRSYFFMAKFIVGERSKWRTCNRVWTCILRRFWLMLRCYPHPFAQFLELKFDLPSLMRLFVGLSPRRPRFNSRLVLVGFVVDEVVL
jgi:hypothetical protein